jgi:Phage Terminase
MTPSTPSRWKSRDIEGQLWAAVTGRSNWIVDPATRIQHDGNPVLEWCISNVVGRYDARSNVLPRKARPEQKIDAAIALIMGIARCMSDTPFVSVYESRGLTIV